MSSNSKRTLNKYTPIPKSKEQRIIKKKSASIRGKVFYSGIIIGIIGCVILRPFKKC